MLVFHLGNGVVEVSANRESISENEHTESVLLPKASHAYALIRTWESNQYNAVQGGNAQDVIDRFKFIGAYLTRNRHEFKDADGNVFALVKEYDWQDRHDASTKLKIKSDTFSSLEVSQFHYEAGDLKPSSKRGKSRRELVLPCEVYVADEEASRQKQLAKIRQHALSGVGTRRIYLLNKGTLSTDFLASLADTFQFTKLSTITLPKAERVKREPVAQDGHFKARVLCKPDGRKRVEEMSIDVATSDKWIYFTDQTEEIEKYDSFRRLAQSAGYNACFVGQRVADKLKDLANLIPAEAFFADPAKYVGAKTYDGLLREFGSLILPVHETVDNLSFLTEKDNTALLDAVKDSVLRSGLRTIAHNESTTSNVRLCLDDYLFKHLISAVKTVDSMRQLRESLPKHIASKYPLLSHIKFKFSDNESEAECRKQVVNYLNTVYVSSL
jgi:hypothetical protein